MHTIAHLEAVKDVLALVHQRIGATAHRLQLVVLRCLVLTCFALHNTGHVILYGHLVHQQQVARHHGERDRT